METTSHTPAPSGKDKMMIYVPANVHRSMRLLAVDRGCPVSAVYVDAARDYLEACGRSVSKLPESPSLASKTAPESIPPDLMDKLGHMAEAIALVLEKLDEPKAAQQADSKLLKPQNVQVADFMRTLLQALVKAGPDGISMPQLNATLRAANLKYGPGPATGRTGFEESAKSTLMQLGIMRHEDGRWYLGPEDPPWSLF